MNEKYIKNGKHLFYLTESDTVEVHPIYQLGKLDGNLIEFYEDGNIKEEQTYKDGKKNGRRISYNPNGNIWMVETYKNGKRNGKYLITKLLKGEK